MKNEIKKVSDREYDKAYEQMLADFEAQTGMRANFEIQFFFSYDRTDVTEKPWERPNYMQVNWSAIGTVMPDNAAAYGKALMVAAKLAESFIYNGYKVAYGD